MLGNLIYARIDYEEEKKMRLKEADEQYLNLLRTVTLLRHGNSLGRGH